MEDRTALLLGATGLVGGFCLNHLLKEPSYGRVVALVRRPLLWQHPKLIQRVVNFDQPASFADFTRADDVFSCLGSTRAKARSREEYRRVDVEIPERIAQFSLEHGASQFLVVSAIGAKRNSFFFYSRLKAELEEAVSRMAFQAVHIFRPGLLVGQRAESRPGESFTTKLAPFISPLLVGPLRKYRPIDAAVVAQAVVEAALAGRSGVNVYEHDQMFAFTRRGA